MRKNNLYCALSLTHHVLHHLNLNFSLFSLVTAKTCSGGMCMFGSQNGTTLSQASYSHQILFALCYQPVIMPVLSRPLEHTIPESDEDVQNNVESKTGIWPCLWQIAVVCLILEQQDVFTVAATGSGKSLTYWMALLYIKYGIVLLVTPLKLFKKQFVEVLTGNKWMPDAFHAMDWYFARSVPENQTL